MIWPFLGIPACYMLAMNELPHSWWFLCYLLAAVLWTFIWWSEHSDKQAN